MQQFFFALCFSELPKGDTTSVFKMGFWKQLKGQSKKTQSSILHQVRLEGKNKAIAEKVSGALPGIPYGAKQSAEVGKKAAKKSKRPEDLIGNVIRYGSREAQRTGKVIGTVGNYMVVIGTLTAQPELVAAGSEMGQMEQAINDATAAGEDLATTIDDVMKGDFESAVVALGNAVKDEGIAVMDGLTDGEFSHALSVAEDIMEGDYSSAKKEAAKALIDGVAAQMKSSHIVDQMDPFVDKGLDMALGQGRKNSSSAVHGGQTTEQATMSDADVFSAENRPDEDDLPGTAARVEQTLPAGDPSPLEEAETEAKASLKRDIVAVNQNKDDELTLCGQGHVTQLKGYLVTDDEVQLSSQDRRKVPRMHGMNHPFKMHQHVGSYSALKMVPVQYKNAGVSVANRLDAPPKVAKVTSMVHENPIKNKLKNRPTVRGFSANFTTNPRHAEQKGDARGDLVRYVDSIKGSVGTVQRSDTDIVRDKSLAPILDTIPEESLVVDAKGPMKPTTRSRMVTRSSARHARQMGSVGKFKSL